MKVAVWDTYVTRRDGSTMHFDILVPDHIVDETTVYEMGKMYLAFKGQEGQPLSARQCRYCHQEAATAEMEALIRTQGFYIIEMEGCD
ncbi:DUF2024 family protein [Pedobacter sp. SYP-B3415]|uniref:DUF2024 family protein n=1 Tax=Pedobacter sp. SYP-B3415 TaxID=2496641 RepID=UPI00101DA351|nr:DUF2024 family protein [Pedobacter sp. SYP-B3415]